MFLNSTTPAYKTPALPTFETILPAKPAFPKLLPINLSPQEIRDMVLEVMG